MKRIKQLMSASAVICVAACVAHAANTDVPPQWNVTPWNATGPTLERFETKPSWAASEVLTTGAGNRSDRFWTSEYPNAGNQLNFATLGITNTFSGARFQPGVPLFIDMRCKLNPFDTMPPAIEPNTLLCFYANEKSNLVVASSTECKTNATITVDPAVYYPILIRFAVDTYDVFFNNVSSPSLSLAAKTNEISKVVISGAGEMDDLYVSFGDPRRTSANSGISLGWTPGNTEEYAIANWLASKTNSGSFAKADAEKFYLTDTAPGGNQFTGELGVGSFSYNPVSSNVTVVVTLKTDQNTKKQGKINGKVQLKGAATYDDAKNGSWTSIAATVLNSNDFDNGVATYTFKLPNTTYKFFLPVIVDDIN